MYCLYEIIDFICGNSVLKVTSGYCTDRKPQCQHLGANDSVSLILAEKSYRKYIYSL